MNALEIIALIFAISILVKLTIFIINPNWLSRWIDVITKQNKLIVIILLAFIVILGYFTFTNLTILQVIPGIILGMLLIGLMLFQFPKPYKTMAKEFFKRKQTTWLFWLLWLILAIWALFAVLN